MRLQSAIFDMDGTLLDSMPTWRELGPTFLREADIEATPEQLHALRTMTDHEVIPYGSTVLIYSEHELVGIYIAEDCGGAIKGNRIDIFYDSHSAAREWGVRECQVYVIDAKG